MRRARSSRSVGPVAPALALSLAIACAHAPASSPDPARACGLDADRLVGLELERRPKAEPVDLYVLVREAIVGPERDVAEADPLAGLGEPTAADLLVEDLDERSGTVRLNLRRWRFIRGTADELRAVLQASARERAPADHGRLEACLEAAARALSRLGRAPEPLRAFARDRAAEGFPARPHSASYEETYRPAYRVVLRRHLPPWVTAPPPTTG